MEYPFFGSRRMAVQLHVNRKRMQRLMRIAGIEALYPKPNLSRPAPGHQIYSKRQTNSSKLPIRRPGA